MTYTFILQANTYPSKKANHLRILMLLLIISENRKKYNTCGNTESQLFIDNNTLQHIATSSLFKTTKETVQNVQSYPYISFVVIVLQMCRDFPLSC